MEELKELEAVENKSVAIAKAENDDFERRLAMAEILAKSGLMPKGMQTKEAVFVALQMGAELGLSPMVAVNNIAVINGKPSLSTDIMHAVARNNREYGGCQWVEQTDMRAECVIIRNNGAYKEEVRGVYTIEDARRAGLLEKDNWKKYPTRMLKHRALSYALRDAFPDVLSGIYTPEELTEGECINITPPEVQERLNAQKPQNGADW